MRKIWPKLAPLRQKYVWVMITLVLTLIVSYFKVFGYSWRKPFIDQEKQHIRILVEKQLYGDALVVVHRLLPHLHGSEKRTYKFLKGYLFGELGYTKKALRECRYALKTGDPLIDYQLFYIGQLLEDMGRLNEADHCFSSQLNNHYLGDLNGRSEFHRLTIHLALNKDAWVKTQLIDYLHRYNATDIAGPISQILIQLIESFPSDETLMNTITDFTSRLYKNRKYHEALMLLNNLRSRNLSPEHRQTILYYCALNSIQLNQWDTARQDLRELYHHHLDERHAVLALFELSRIARFQNDESSEIQYLGMLRHEFPNCEQTPEVLFDWATHYYLRHEDSEAITTYQFLTNKYADSSLTDDALWKIGFIYYKKKNYSASYKYFKDAVQRNKGDYYLPSLYWLGHVALAMHHDNEAKKLFLQVQKMYPFSYYSYRIYERFGYTLMPQPKHKKQLTPFAFKKYDQLIALGLVNEAFQQIKAALLYLPPNHPSRQHLLDYLSTYNQHFPVSSSSRIVIMDPNSIDNSDENPINRNPHDLYFLYPIFFIDTIRTMAKKYTVDPFLISAIIHEESQFKISATSKSGAIGLMQLLPQTAKLIADKCEIKYSTTEELYSPFLNIRLGTHFLKNMLTQWHDNKILSLASYNGGPTNVTKWLKDQKITDIDVFVEDIPFLETRLYVKKVLENYWVYKMIYDRI